MVLVTTSGVPVAPKRPSGLWLERTDRGGGTFQVTIHWHRVTERTDGSALTNLAGYEIFTAPSLLLPRAQWTALPNVTSEEWSTTTAANGAVTYYCLKAVDANGLESDWTQIVDDSVDLNHFFIYADNISRIQLPQSAADKLRREKNAYGSDLWIDIVEVPAEEMGRVVRSMKMTIINTDTGNAVTDLLFDPPVLRGVIGYAVQNGQVVAGAPEFRVSSSEFRDGFNSQLATLNSKLGVIPASKAAAQLSLFWFNGAEWVKTTGMVNSADNTVSFTGSRAGAFQIRAASHGTGATLTRVYPRIITPNGDGWNDKAIFQFDNPELLPLSGKIYDITGALVAPLTVGPNPDSTLSWNGKDSGGTVVPGGIYVYQIDLGGTMESGTVVVAR
jgi:hypothetical protein